MCVHKQRKQCSTMDMVRVDPKLFVMCRLCVENFGVYQITPGVRDQIKFCFDIDVDPFDGLPQLLCDGCELVLSDYYTKKRTFVGKQNALKARLQLRKGSEPSHSVQNLDLNASGDVQEFIDDKSTKEIEEDAATSQQPLVDNSSQLNNEDREKQSCGTKRRRISSSSDSKSNTSSRNRSSSRSSKKLSTNTTKNITDTSWTSCYNRLYVCRYCELRCKTRGNMRGHLRKHKKLFKKYNDVFKKYCKVTLNKVDGEPNITNQNNTIAYNQNKILCDEGKMNYYAIHFLEDDDDAKRTDTESDISDVVFKPKLNRRVGRIMSGSSTDTVVLNDAKGSHSSHIDVKNKIDPNVSECINIDDSSDSASEDTENSRKHSKDGVANSTMNLTITNNDATIQPISESYIKPTSKHYKAIVNIVSMCLSRYIKKALVLKENEKQMANSRNKLLNIGLKIIRKDHFKCTGILRYLEQANLEIRWLPTNASEQTTSTKSVRIMPRLKDVTDSDSVFKWESYADCSDNKTVTENESVLKWESQANYSDNIQSAMKQMPSQSVEVIETAEEGKCTDVSSTNNAQDSSTTIDNFVSNSAVLYSDLQSGDQDKKILNANPVPNPKQLPKKSTVSESKILTPRIVTPVTQEPIENINVPKSLLCSPGNTINTNSEDTDMCMPVITSTTSLAIPKSTPTIQNGVSSDCPTNSNENNSKETIQEVPQAHVPWIKVKPVSELMPQSIPDNRTTVNHQQSNLSNILILPMQNVEKHMTMTPQISNVMSMVKPYLENMLPASASLSGTGNREYLVLDTPEMPNMRTDSPFKYFQNLLRVHKINLLNNSSKPPRSFHILIKFKLQFSQQAVQQPVILGLSLFCLQNNFYIGVRDPNHPDNIDLQKLSANWQWEILKIYKLRDLVVTKLLQNAEKIDQNTLEYTKTFVSVLQSIKVKSEDHKLIIT